MNLAFKQAPLKKVQSSDSESHKSKKAEVECQQQNSKKNTNHGVQHTKQHKNIKHMGPGLLFGSLPGAPVRDQRSLCVRAITNVLANAAGFPVGREGPMVIWKHHNSFFLLVCFPLVFLICVCFVLPSLLSDLSFTFWLGG